MKPRRWLIFGIVLFTTICRLPARAATPDQIDNSIHHGVDSLYSKQKNGNWERLDKRDPTSKPYSMDGGQWGTTTAVATYALLAAGESPEDARIKQAVQFLLKADLVGTCAIGLRADVLNLLPKTPEIKQAMLKDMQSLKTGMRGSGASKGFYDYVIPPEKGSHFDHRYSQYAVDGMWACAQNLEGVPPDYWQTVDKAWRDDQHDSGAWSTYEKSNEKNPDSVSMTAAGVVTLFVANDFLSRSKSLEPVGNGSDKNIDRGIQWIADNYKTLFEKGSPQSPHPPYGLYCVERIGAASGYKYLGNVNWYDDGADYLIKTQYKSGGWSGTVDTAFAILFLSRGRAPVGISKLDYDITDGGQSKPGNWNQRPRDAANLVKFVGKQIEHPINWEIVNLKAPVDELHDSPILYISGNQALMLTDDEKQKLKLFVQQGGLIFAQADAASSLFANSIKKLGTELFPYEFRQLPANHPIFTNEQFDADKWTHKPTILGLSNGVRELILLMSDGDPGRYWQAYDVGTHAELFELVSDIYLYSIDKQNLRTKGQSYQVKIDKKYKPAATITVGRVKYDGNWDPEPGGWTRLNAIMNNQKATQIDTKVVDLIKLSSSDVNIAHLTGAGPTKFDPFSMAAMKSYINRGGVLIIDSAGGSPQFAQSIEQQLDATFGDEAKSLKDPLPPDHRIYRGVEIAWRAFARQNLTGDLHGGRIRMMLHDGKPAIIYSAEDLSAGLVGEPIDGIIGYEPKTATYLMANILQYAANPK